MKPQTFPEQNITYAKYQPEYLPLPAFSDEKTTISLWALTWRERWKILFSGRLWLLQLNRGTALQPQLPTVDYPFEVDKASSE